MKVESDSNSSDNTLLQRMLKNQQGVSLQGAANETYTLSAKYKHDGASGNLMFGLLIQDGDVDDDINNQYYANNIVPTEVEDLGDGWKYGYVTFNLPTNPDYGLWSDSTEFRVLLRDGNIPTGTTYYYADAMLERGNFSNTYIENILYSDIEADLTDGLVGLTLSGKILNSPLAFCDGDNFLIDASRGFGSDEYSLSFKVDGGQFGSVNIGHPSYLIPCTNDTDCAGIGEQTCSNSYCYVLSGYYYSTLTEYDGWSIEKSQLYPSNIGENELIQLILKIKRYFGRFEGNNTSYLATEEVLPTITINIIGINPPHIHFLNYEREDKPQIGVQPTQVLTNQPTLKYYDNINNDLLSTEYIEELDGGISINTSDDFGIKSIGSIDFSTYEGIIGQQPRGKLIINGDIIISNEFSAYTEVTDNGISYIWDNIIEAVNNYPSGYSARLSEFSDTNPNSNLKEVIIEAIKVGKKYNGVLG